MENASKALLIAGSILLAILIIAVGIYIFNAVNIDIEPQMSQMEVNIFNQEYLMYEGVQSGKRVKEVLVKAAIYNGQYTGDSFKSGDFNNVLSKYGFGIRGRARDIIKEAEKLTSDWVQQLTFQGNYKVGVAQPPNIRKIAGWIKASKRYKVSFTYMNNGRIREIIVDDVE